MKAAKWDKRFNLYTFENASQRQNRAQIDKIIVPYKGTILLKSPIWLKKGSSKAVKPNRAKVKFVFLSPIKR